MRIELQPRAYKDLEKFPIGIREQIVDDIEIWSVTPWPGAPAVKKIKKTLYRLRSGGYRVIFEKEKNIVIILRIVDRKDLERMLQKFL